MSNFPHYSNGDRMEEGDLFLYGDKLAILDNIWFDVQQNHSIVWFRTGNDLIKVPFDLLENSNIELVKIEGDKPKKGAKYIVTFYFDNKESYSTGISEDIVESIATGGLSKQNISSQDLMFMLSPEDNTSVGINLNKITHFEIEERF